MIINVSMDFSEENDGVNQHIDFCRGNIEDAYGMAQFFAALMQAAGYTYVKDVGFLYDTGEELWGERF
jgi:hypothetical protein